MRTSNASRRASERSAGGFTLIELLVVIAILFGDGSVRFASLARDLPTYEVGGLRVLDWLPKPRRS
jgi:hypothetical protein